MLNIRTTHFSKFDNYSLAILAFALLAVGFGIYFRLKGLDKSPFTDDEYYLAASVKNILKHGLPQYDCGGYYVRGLILQYLAVPFFAYGTNDEYWLRLITVFTNLLALPAIYLLGKQVSGKTVGYLAVILFSLSIWETEFARFARMYAPFQTLFIWYLLFLYRRIVLGDMTARQWMHLFSFLSVFMYEGAIFLVLLNFMPLLSSVRKTSVQENLIALFIFVIAYIYLSHDFRHLGITDYLPPDLAPAESSFRSLPIALPMILMASLPSNPAWLIPFAFISVLSLFVIWYFFLSYKSHTDLELHHVLLFSLLILLALFNLFALIIYLLLLALLLRHLHLRQFYYLPVVLSIATIMIIGLFWICYGLLNNDWFTALASGHTSQLKALLVTLLKYPDVVTKIIYPWFFPMPKMTLIAAPLIICGAFLAIAKNRKDDQGYLFLLTVSLISILMLAVLQQTYTSSRYTFFLYPIVLLLIIVSFRLLILLINKNLIHVHTALIGLSLVFMVISEDFGLDHLWNIDSERILYRMDYDSHRTSHYYPRWDYRAVGNFIHTNMEYGDIVASSARSIQYYLEKFDYLYIDQDASIIMLRDALACGGTKDLWTNANLVYKPEKFSRLIEDNHSTIWLVLKLHRWSSQIEKDLAKRYKEFHLFQSVDGHLNVFKIPAGHHPKIGSGPISNAILGT